ncbi:unnamed protein product [Phaeothamnion confervicola]
MRNLHHRKAKKRGFTFGAVMVCGVATLVLTGWAAAVLLLRGLATDRRASTARNALYDSALAMPPPGRMYSVAYIVSGDGTPLPPDLQDYSCPENAGQDASKCSLPCGNDRDGGKPCVEAIRACEDQAWCTHVVVAAGVAWLKHSPEGMAPDGSEELLEGLQLPPEMLDARGGEGVPAKPRIYMIVSAGSAHGEFLAHFLTEVAGAAHVRRIYHVLDADPPTTLRYANLLAGEKDRKVGNLPANDPAAVEAAAAAREVPPDLMDGVRVVFVYGDPAAVLAAEYGADLCKALHSAGDGGGACSWWSLPKSLTALATLAGGVGGSGGGGGSPIGIGGGAAGKGRIVDDRVGLGALYRAYLQPRRRFDYPVVALNADKMWDHAAVVLTALGLPASLAPAFEALAPQWRRQRRDKPEERLSVGVAAQLRALYAGDVLPLVLRMPAVKVVYRPSDTGDFEESSE